MAFNAVPSQLQEFYWQMSFRDIQTKLRLFISEKQWVINQNYQVFRQVVSEALGGTAGGASNEKVFQPKTQAEALAMFKKVVG